ncbi:Uma2 family endonuclease [Planktothrix mougeotii]|uniref:Uma2 family endonuclease n=1 Tax=Planktothrix mougeotii LEGE 06226 TaxID=1828728 RepID=A0ABR9UC36_9CYAN|nr:Uma2 family endonuclease [Planktothrix mougeotii]MBE9144032.1 Uma2 family endonuclease [Planktothrix mougeotii LEGE 06226]
MIQTEHKTQIQSLSLEEFLTQPETKPVQEYINGVVYQKPMPKGKHSRIQKRLIDAISEVGEVKKLACAFPELRCTFGGRSIVPDIVVFEWQNIPLDEQGEIANDVTIAPDWTIEILSPEQNTTRVINNILFCLKHQTQLGWLIDPQERLVLVFKPKQEPEVFEGEQILPILDRLKNYQLSVNQLFSWLSF